MEMEGLECKLDELNTRIALAEHEIDITLTSSDTYLRMLRELNHMRIKRIALEQRIRRLKSRYESRVYLPDIKVIR